MLVVDDSPSMRGLVADLLEADGYATLASADGVTALARAHAELPCLALVDIRMPIMDGPTFARACRDDGILHDMPIVLLSALRHEACACGPEEGVDGFIPKPFYTHELLNGVETAIGPAEASVAASAPG